MNECSIVSYWSIVFMMFCTVICMAEYQTDTYLSITSFNSTCDYPEQLNGGKLPKEREEEREGGRGRDGGRERYCVNLFCFLAHAGAIVRIVLGIMFLLSVLISISACIGVAWSISRSRRNPVAYHAVDNADTTDSTTSSSFSTQATTNSTSSYQPVNQPLYISGTPASQHHNIHQYIPTSLRAPVLTAANNETTTQPLPNTAPLVSSFSPAQTVVGRVSSDIVWIHQYQISYPAVYACHWDTGVDTMLSYICTYCNSSVVCCVAVCVGNKNNREVVWDSVSLCRLSFVNYIHQLWYKLINMYSRPRLLHLTCHIYIYTISFPHFKGLTLHATGSLPLFAMVSVKQIFFPIVIAAILVAVQGELNYFKVDG